MNIKFGVKYKIYPYVLDFRPSWYIEHLANTVKKQNKATKISWLDENVGEENYLLYFDDRLVPCHVMFKNEEDAMAFKLRFI